MTIVSNHNQVNIIQIIAIVVSSFSLLGAIFIIGIFLSFKKLRVFPFIYVFWLSVSDLISSIGYLLVTDSIGDTPEQLQEANFTCKTQALMINFGQLASICWTAVIAWTLYNSTVKVVTNLQQKTETKMVAIAFGFPLIMSLIPLILNEYGPQGGWCWIKSDSDNKVLSFILVGIEFYIPLWIAFVFNGITIYRVIRYVKSITQDKNQLKLINRLTLYPLILLVCWSAGTVERVFDFIGISSEILSYLHIFFGGLQGFFNACVYGLNSNVRKVIRENLCSSLPCFASAYIYEEQNLNEAEDHQQDSKKTASISSGEGQVEMEQLNQ
ncbi:hypothetical protein ABPG74_017619 [Tetrahymena malaccensis]